MGFRLLDHTADVCAECEAPDFAGLLKVAAQALYEVALETVRDQAASTQNVRIEGAGREETLVRWLQEVLFLLDVEHFVAVDVQFERVAPTEVCATLRGYVHEPDERATEVKAATYHEMEVREREEGLVATIVFDL